MIDAAERVASSDDVLWRSVRMNGESSIATRAQSAHCMFSQELVCKFAANAGSRNLQAQV